MESYSTDSRIRAWWQLARGGNALMSAVAALIGAYLARGQFDLTVWLLVPLAPLFITAAGNIQNDLLDRIIDQLNHPSRPLVSGAISLSTARLAMNAFYIIGMVAAASLSSIALTIAGLVVLGLTLYNLRLSRRPLIGNLMVAVLASLPILYGGVGVDGFTGGRWVIAASAALIAFWLHLARELLKDAVDTKGDAHAGRRTVPLIFGESLAIRLGAVAMIIGAGFSVLPWFTGELGVIYLAGVVLTVIPSLLLGAAQCLGRPLTPVASLWATWLKVTMLAGLVWIVLGVWTSH